MKLSCPCNQHIVPCGCSCRLEKAGDRYRTSGSAITPTTNMVCYNQVYRQAKFNYFLSRLLISLVVSMFSEIRTQLCRLTNAFCLKPSCWWKISFSSIICRFEAWKTLRKNIKYLYLQTIKLIILLGFQLLSFTMTTWLILFDCSFDIIGDGLMHLVCIWIVLMNP